MSARCSTNPSWSRMRLAMSNSAMIQMVRQLARSIHPGRCCQVAPRDHNTLWCLTTAGVVPVVVWRVKLTTPTIYSAFGTKARVLEEIARLTIAPLDVANQHVEARATPDP